MTEKRSIGERIIKASVAIFVAHLCFKLLGFAQFFVVGTVIETSQWETIYGFAFEGVIFSLFLIGEELIGPAFLPIFMAEKEEKSATAAWRIANTLLTFQCLILGLVVMALMLFPEQLTSLVTYWDAKSKPEYFSLAVSGVKIMAPALFFFSIGSTTYMLLNGYKKFFLAAFGDAVWKAFILGGVVLGIGVFGLSWKALAFGVVLGSVGKILTHLIGLFREMKYIRIDFSLNNPAFKTMLILMLPLFIGIVFAKVRDFYNHITVLSSMDAGGLIKANAYGRKLFQAIGMVLPYTLSIAMFPFFCDLVARKDQKGLGEILTRSGRMLMVVFIPMGIVFTVYSHTLIKVLVMGKFSAMDAQLAGISMACYTLVLPAYSLEMLLMQAYFANRRTYAVTIIGILFSSFSILVSYLGVIKFGATGAMALMVVALGYVFSRFFKTLTLIGLLRKTVPMFPLLETFSFIIRLMLIGCASALAVWGVFYAFDVFLGDNPGKIMLMVKLLAGVAAAGVLYFLGIWLLKVRELWEMIEWGKKKIQDKLKGAEQA